MDAVFSALELDSAAQHAYRTILHDGPKAQVELADDLTVKDLEAAGLVHLDELGVVHACPPRTATELWAVRRELEISQVRKAAEVLTQEYRGRQSRSSDIIEWVVGRERSRELFASLQQRAQREIKGFDRGPYVHASGTVEPDQVAAHERGVSIRVVYESSVLHDKDKLASVDDCVAAGEQARVFSGVPLKLFVSDDDIAMISLPGASSGESSESTSLLAYPSPLLDALIELFESFWRLSVPFDPGGVGGPSESLERAADTRRLLHLLAAGLSDKAIARDLGISERTLHRRMSKLHERLGVRSRFQIGVQAARNGWI